MCIRIFLKSSQNLKDINCFSRVHLLFKIDIAANLSFKVYMLHICLFLARVCACSFYNLKILMPFILQCRLLVALRTFALCAHKDFFSSWNSSALLSRVFLMTIPKQFCLKFFLSVYKLAVFTMITKQISPVTL